MSSNVVYVVVFSSKSSPSLYRRIWWAFSESLYPFINKWSWSWLDFGGGGDHKHRRMHWRSWEKLFRPKIFGGLGFKDLARFNQPLLAKQGWPTLTHPYSLVERVLKSNYFPTTTFLEVKMSNSASHPCRSIFWDAKTKNRATTRRWRM